MTLEERRELVKQIAKVGGGSDQILELLKNLNEDIEAAGNSGEPVPDGFETWSAALGASKKETEAANQRYIDRFFDGDSKDTHKEPDGDEGKPGPGDNDENKKPHEYDDLFETESKEEK